MTATERRLIQRFTRSRSAALNNTARAEWMNAVDVIADYMDGKQYPQDYDETFGESYRVINVLPDMMDRIIAMVGGGRLEATMVKRDETIDELLRMAHALFDYWKETANAKGLAHEGIGNAVTYGLSAWRLYVDPTQMLAPGPYIGIETPHPGQVWINPRANNPYHPLLGSDHIGFETWKTRRELMDMYPKRAAIRELPAFDLGNVTSIDHPLYQAVRLNDNVGRNDADTDKYSRTGRSGVADDAEHDSADDFLQVSEYAYESVEHREMEGVDIPIRVWKSYTVVGDARDGDKAIVAGLEEESPYGLPNFVLCVANRRIGTPWSMGLPWRVLDVQDEINVFASDVTANLQSDSQYRGVKFGRAGAFEEDDRELMLAGKPNRYMEIDPKGEYRDKDINQIIGQLTVTDIDYYKKLQLIEQKFNQARTLLGVNSSVVGDTPVEKRVSGIAISTAQQATLVAQETLRLHVDAAMTNIARLAWQMIRHHWIVPHHLPALAGHRDYWLNQRVPVTPETSEGVDRMMASGDYRDERGRTMVPTGFIGITGDDETAIPIEENAQIEGAIRENEFEGMEFGFNYLPLLDLDVKMVVAADADQRNARRREMMAWAAQMPKGTWSDREVTSEAKRDDPGFSYEQHTSELMDDEIAKLLLQLEQAQGPDIKAQAIQALQTMLASGQRGLPQAGGVAPQMESAGGAGAPPATAAVPQMG